MFIIDDMRKQEQFHILSDIKDRVLFYTQEIKDKAMPAENGSALENRYKTAQQKYLALHCGQFLPLFR